MIENVTEALAEARALGFLGPGPLDAHVASADAFADALGRVDAGGPLLDLGSGGGVPGLLLAVAMPSTRWVLLDSNRRRTSFLARVVAELGLADRVEVVRAAAEVAAHDPAQRSRFAVVTSRSFGPPAATAEAAVGFLRAGGRLLVAEPPGVAEGRWPEVGVARAGLFMVGHTGSAPRIATLEAPAGPPVGLPRSRREMDRAPLWS